MIAKLWASGFFASRDGKNAATPSALFGCQTANLADMDIDPLLAIAFHGDHDALEELAHDGLVICRGGRCGMPERRSICDQSADRLALLGPKAVRMSCHKAFVVSTECCLGVQGILPLILQSTRHQAVFWFDGVVSPRGPLNFVMQSVKMGLETWAAAVAGPHFLSEGGTTKGHDLYFL